MPASLLAEGFRRAVLDFLVKNEVSVAAEDAEGRKKLAGYMLREDCCPGIPLSPRLTAPRVDSITYQECRLKLRVT